MWFKRTELGGQQGAEAGALVREEGQPALRRASWLSAAPCTVHTAWPLASAGQHPRKQQRGHLELPGGVRVTG